MELLEVLVGLIFLIIWILIVIAVLRIPGLLNNIAKEIRQSRKSAHEDAVALSELLSVVDSETIEE